MKTVGVIGCGLMGQGIVKNLLKNNFIVYINDINEDAIEKLVNEGAKATESIEEIASKVECLILSLPSPQLIKQIMLDEQNGAISFMQPGSYILDMSTNDVGATREIHDKAQSKNIEFFDCPLSGGPSGADSGTLTIMVGGNKEAFTSIMSVLNAVGSHIEYIGQSGAGQVVKLCHNMVVGGVIALLSETFLTGEQAGVSKEKIASILQKGSGQTKVMEVFGPNLLNSTFQEVKFSLSNMQKDIHLYQRLAETSKVPTFASQMIHQLYQVSQNRGKGQSDSTVVYEFLAELGGDKKSPVQ
ncbi:NAD(P)-dependent oxidoreductase [Oceanobacillus halotolerans]|uniref:NAD(P)-dependent oxidoreductase n=1 Tax=Oceanobacillus halotolerans TaxID=2663380 RepID=UPI0013DCCDF2|nr:NAD(P)-dependent oxidoreductase [Oceanobacillus halotolerans]